VLGTEGRLPPNKDRAPKGTVEETEQRVFDVLYPKIRVVYGRERAASDEGPELTAMLSPKLYAVERAVDVVAVGYIAEVVGLLLGQMKPLVD
jgi:hypothetical protein